MSQSPDQAVSPYDAMGLLSSDPYHQPDQAAGPCQAPDHAASPTPPPATLDPYGVPATHPAHSALAANDHYMVDPMVDPYGCAPLTPPVSPAAKAASPLQAAALDPHGGAPFTPPVPTTAEMLDPYGVPAYAALAGSRCQYRDIRLRHCDAYMVYGTCRYIDQPGQSAWQPAAPQVAQSRTRHPRPLIFAPESESDDATIRFRTPSPPYSTPDSTDPEPIASLETRPNPRIQLVPPGKRARLFNQPLPDAVRAGTTEQSQSNRWTAQSQSSAATGSSSDAVRAGLMCAQSNHGAARLQAAAPRPPFPDVDSPPPESTDSLPRTIQQRAGSSIRSSSSESREAESAWRTSVGWRGEPEAEPAGL